MHIINSFDYFIKKKNCCFISFIVIIRRLFKNEKSIDDHTHAFAGSSLSAS